MAAGIYRIHNKINNKNYIGRSSNLENRQKQHWQEMENGGKNSVWNHDVEKYGLDSFEWIVEEIVSDENDTLKMQYLEDYYIAKYKSFGANGYNSKRGDVNVISSASSMPFADIKDGLENYALETFYDNDYYDVLKDVDSAKEFFPPYVYPFEYAEMVGIAFNIPPHKVYDDIPRGYYAWSDITKLHIMDAGGKATEKPGNVLSKANLKKLVLDKSDTIYFTDLVYPKIIYDFYKAIFDKYEIFLHTMPSEDTYFDKLEDVMPAWMAKICSFGFNGIFETSDYPHIKTIYLLFSRFSTYKNIEKTDFKVDQYYHYVQEFLFSDTPLSEIGKE